MFFTTPSSTMPSFRPWTSSAALLRTRLLQHRAAADDDVAAGAVHLEDLEGLRLAHQRADVAHGADVHLAARQEGDGAAEIHREATLYPAEQDAVHALVGGEGLLQVRPGFLAPRLLTGEDDRAVLVLVALDEKVHHIAGLHLGLHALGCEFLEGNAAFALEADIHHGEVIIDADDLAGDDGAGEAGIGAQHLVEKRGEIFPRTRGGVVGTCHVKVLSWVLCGAWPRMPVLRHTPRSDGTSRLAAPSGGTARKGRVTVHPDPVFSMSGINLCYIRRVRRSVKRKSA
jgi:hypothetical protein